MNTSMALNADLAQLESHGAVGQKEKTVSPQTQSSTSTVPLL